MTNRNVAVLLDFPLAQTSLFLTFFGELIGYWKMIFWDRGGYRFCVVRQEAKHSFPG
jgi:hypothetical protein